VKVKATILAVCFIAAVPAMASADDTVLLLHPGGFGFDDPSRMEMPAEAFESAGYRTVYLDYTLGDLPQAWRETKAAIRRYSVDYAYGESAGAVLAGLAGQRGLVDAAVMNSGLSNLTPRAADSWMRDALGLTDEQRALYSPGLRRSLAPVLTLASPEDLHYFRRSNLSWAKRDPLVRFGRTPGGHIYGRASVEGADYPGILDRAVRYVATHKPRIVVNDPIG
jgi:hypothetical protein